MKTKFKIKNILILLILTIALCGGALLGINLNSVNAESEQVTVTFYGEHLGFENTVLTIDKGSSLSSTDLPATPADEDIYQYVWSYNYYDLQNITEDLTINLIRRINPSLMHTVTFIFPDGTQKTVQVVNGGDITDPPTSDDLGFGERNSYSLNLNNITSDMNVMVGVDKTIKYVVVCLSGAALITGFAIVFVVMSKMFNKNDELQEDTTE